MAEMKLNVLKVEKGMRIYEREDGTCWQIVKEYDLDCWSIYQVDTSTGATVYDDPRCGIGEGVSFAPNLKATLYCLRNNCTW